MTAQDIILIIGVGPGASAVAAHTRAEVCKDVVVVDGPFANPSILLKSYQLPDPIKYDVYQNRSMRRRNKNRK